jgi:hypothetical protein
MPKLRLLMIHSFCYVQNPFSMNTTRQFYTLNLNQMSR